MNRFKNLAETEINEKTPEERKESREEYYKLTDKAMDAFVKGLEALTKKTGISVECTGGLYYDEPKEIKSVQYSNDFSSGDLSVKIK